MGRLTDSNQTLVEQNGRKRFMQKIAVSAVAGITTLVTADVYGTAVPPGATLFLQGSIDFWYELRPAGGATAVTNYAGSRPGIHVLTDAQERVVSMGGNVPDTQIDLVASGAGSVDVFWAE